jgi:hypothetical protein
MAGSHYYCAQRSDIHLQVQKREDLKKNFSMHTRLFYPTGQSENPPRTDSSFNMVWENGVTTGRGPTVPRGL